MIKPLELNKNKKGNIMVPVIFIVLLFVVLFLGFIMIVGSTVLNWVFDEAVPELTNLGQIGDTNFTRAANATIVPLNTVVQSMTWLTGVLYVMFLIAIIAFALMLKMDMGSRWLLGFYFALMLILIMGSIFVSNMYEDFRTGSNDLSDRLKEHTILDYMILYSPAIFTAVGFLTGIVLFSGRQEAF